MSAVAIKICGLSTPETLDAAITGGADLVGFVHFARSPRHVDLEAGRALSAQARGRVERVVLLVDPDDAGVAAAVEALDPDWIQLHGRETPERVAAIRVHGDAEGDEPDRGDRGQGTRRQEYQRMRSGIRSAPR